MYAQNLGTESGRERERRSPAIPAASLQVVQTGLGIESLINPSFTKQLCSLLTPIQL
jgi:hypothetical protein